MATTSSATSGSITSMGIGSGIDISGIIDQLMTVERLPLKKLDANIQTDQAKISALGSVQSALSAFQGRVLTLSSASSYTSVKGSLADSTIGTVSTTVTAQSGSYNLSVSQLAQSQKLKSQSFATVNDPVGTGKLTVQFGTFTDNSAVVPATPNTFVANGNKGSFDITIDSTNNTLSGLRDAINGKNAGVSATIVNDGTGFRLLLTSTDSGSANSLKLSVADDDGNNTDTNGLSRFAYDPLGTKNLSQTQAAQDAKFTLDGIDITKSSNTVSDVLNGVTLTLQKISALDGSSKPIPTTLTVAGDTSKIASSVQDFVKSYNDFNKALNAVSFFNDKATDSTQKAGILNGDSTIRSLQRTLRQTLNSTLGGGGFYQSLGAVGIGFDKTGNMTLDSGKLQNALSTKPGDVASLFAVNGMATDSRISYLNSSQDTQAGQYAVSITSPASQAKLMGASVPNAPITITAGSNDSLMVAVDGVSSSMITLSAGSYAPASLAAEMQSKINGDSALKAAGVSVIVGYNTTSGKFEMTSNRYGSKSNVQVTSVGSTATATYGLSVGLIGSGSDVQGTIGGASASGNGQVLTASGAATGLQVNVTATTAGDFGTVSFSRGFASRLDQSITTLLSSSGPIQSRVAGLNKDITNIQNREKDLNLRFDQIEVRYRAQFSAMDSIVGHLKATSTFLSQQLTSLTGSNK